MLYDVKRGPVYPMLILIKGCCITYACICYRYTEKQCTNSDFVNRRNWTTRDSSLDREFNGESNAAQKRLLSILFERSESFTIFKN